MSFSVYENMCKNLYEGDDGEYLFAHAFLKMKWNLMARADNCVNMHVNKGSGPNFATFSNPVYCCFLCYNFSSR